MNNRRPAAAHCCRFRYAYHGAQDGIRVYNPAVGIGSANPNRRGFGKKPEILVKLANRFFGHFTVVNILHHTDTVKLAALGVQYSASGSRDPTDTAIFTKVALLHLVGWRTQLKIVS